MHVKLCTSRDHSNGQTQLLKHIFATYTWPGKSSILGQRAIEWMYIQNISALLQPARRSFSTDLCICLLFQGGLDWCKWFYTKIPEPGMQKPINIPQLYFYSLQKPRLTCLWHCCYSWCNLLAVHGCCPVFASGTFSWLIDRDCTYFEVEFNSNCWLFGAEDGERPQQECLSKPLW